MFYIGLALITGGSTLLVATVIASRRMEKAKRDALEQVRHVAELLKEVDERIERERDLLEKIEREMPIKAEKALLTTLRTLLPRADKDQQPAIYSLIQLLEKRLGDGIDYDALAEQAGC